MAHLTRNRIAQTGTAVSLAAAAGGGDTFDSGARTFLLVTNGGSSSVTVTVHAVQVCSQGVLHDLAVAVAAGATKQIGPLDPARFGETASVTYSGVTSVTVGVFTT